MATETRMEISALLRELEKAGLDQKMKTLALVMAAAAVNGFRPFETGCDFVVPLTGTPMRLKASFDIGHSAEITEGEFKPEVRHG